MSQLSGNMSRVAGTGCVSLKTNAVVVELMYHNLESSKYIWKMVWRKSTNHRWSMTSSGNIEKKDLGLAWTLLT